MAAFKLLQIRVSCSFSNKGRLHHFRQLINFSF